MSTRIGSSHLHIVYAVYDSSYDNHPLSQKLDPRLPSHILCTTHPPSLPVNSFEDEKRTEQECINAVHDTLRTKAGDESLLPVMWSLYQ